MSKYSVRNVWGRFAFAAGGALAIAASPGASAQTTTTTTTTTTPAPAPASDQDQTVKMEQYVVTGSNIPQAAEALAVPVQTIDQVSMQESGVNFNTLDLLRKATPNIMGIGAENAQTESAATFGGAQANIKGLPTLVLIDGLRVANDPGESTGADQFVNLNLIPLAAIDRIEVLQDGASAVYGSDAVGGVINIILKKDYNGWEVGGHFGEAPSAGRYEERSGYVAGGVSNDKTSITLSFEVAENTPLFENTRPYTNPFYGTDTFPGSLEVYDNLSGSDQFYELAPGLNAPPGGGKYTIAQLVSMGVYVPQTQQQNFDTFNLAKGETLFAALKRFSGMTNIEHHIFGDNLIGYGNIMFSHTYTWSQLNAQPVVPYVEDPWIDVNVFGSVSPPPVGTTFVPVTAPGNPFSQAFLDQNQSQPESQPGYGDGSGEEILARARFVAYPRVYQNDDDLYRIVGGLKGDITDDYHWDISANIDRYDLHYTNPGLIDTSALNAALVDGQINPFAVTQAPGAFNGVVGTAFVNQLSTLNQFDAKLTGTPFTLPGGKLGFAGGFEYVLETLSATPDENSLPNAEGTTQGWSNATTFQQFDAKRDFDSIFGEISVPITGPSQGIPGLYSVNLDAAVRYDSYSGQVGASTDPQVTMSWSPIDADFKLRASAGKSFLAPQLFSLYGPVSSGSTEEVTYNPVGGGAPRSNQFNQTGGSNPSLKPTTANTWTAGFVYTPKQLSGLTVSVDYSDIFEKGVVGVAPVATIIQSVETSGTGSPYVADVHYNSPNGPEVSGPGGISSRSPQSIYVIQNLINLAASRVDSTDIQVEYVLPTQAGRWDFSSTWTWYNRYLLQIIPTENYYDYTGTASTEEGTVPKWRGYTTANWKLSGLEATVGLTYIDSVQDIGAAGDNQSGFERVSSFTAWDFQLAYDFGHLNANKWLNGLRVDVGINNAFNRIPPEALSAFSGETNADVGTYLGPIGRMVYVDARYKF